MNTNANDDELQIQRRVFVYLYLAITPVSAKSAYVSMSEIYQIFDNLHMLWMCIWMCPHHVMADHSHQAFGIFLKIWATLSQ